MKDKISLPNGYRPSEDEAFMSPLQREYFRQKILKWKQEIFQGSEETLFHLKEDSGLESDLNDRASVELDRSLELRTRDRERKLLNKIEAALRRIEDGTYGYCEETGEPIGVRRLDARPIATLSISAQERHELKEKTYREEEL